MPRTAAALAAALSLAACADLRPAAGDGRQAVVLAPYQRPLGLNTIRLEQGALLLPTTRDGRTAWCSHEPAYFEPLPVLWLAPPVSRRMCFTDPRGDQIEGWFKSAWVPNTIGTFEVDVPYRVRDVTPGLPPRY